MFRDAAPGGTVGGTCPVRGPAGVVDRRAAAGTAPGLLGTRGSGLSVTAVTAPRHCKRHEKTISTRIYIKIAPAVEPARALPRRSQLIGRQM